MSHKVTFDLLAAQVARTMQALPNADWNEPSPSPKPPSPTPASANSHNQERRS